MDKQSKAIEEAMKQIEYIDAGIRDGIENNVGVEKRLQNLLYKFIESAISVSCKIQTFDILSIA